MPQFINSAQKDGLYSWFSYIYSVCDDNDNVVLISLSIITIETIIIRNLYEKCSQMC